MLRSYFFLSCILITISTSALVLPTSSATASTCESLLSGDPDPWPLYSTGDTYALLAEIDAADCGKITQEAFAAFIDAREVNIVSYSLLEKRLLDGGDPIREEALATYVGEYREAGKPFGANAVLPLIDIAYYECGGEQACIARFVLELVGDEPLRDPASCLYAMPSRCKDDGRAASFVFLNDETIEALPDPENAFAEREKFVCARYGDCD